MDLYYLLAWDAMEIAMVFLLASTVFFGKVKIIPKYKNDIASGMKVFLSISVVHWAVLLFLSPFLLNFGTNVDTIKEFVRFGLALLSAVIVFSLTVLVVEFFILEFLDS